MRINKFVAAASSLSRRAADAAITEGRVLVNGVRPLIGQTVNDGDTVTLDNLAITPPVKTVTIMLHKPVGYVVSRDGQGSNTVYDLLPPEYQTLKPVGRLDKDSSGLLLLTNDGQLANELTHPRYIKEKVYEVTLDKPLTDGDLAKLERGVSVEDYISHLRLSKLENRKLKIENCLWQVSMTQGRNRQIRHTFAALGYAVTKLHRTHFGDYALGDLAVRDYTLAGT